MIHLILSAAPAQADQAQQVVDGWAALGPGYATAAALTVIIGIGLIYEIRRQHNQREKMRDRLRDRIHKLENDKEDLNAYIREVNSDHVQGIHESVQLLRTVAEDTEGLTDEIRTLLEQYDRRIERLLIRAGELSDG